MSPAMQPCPACGNPIHPIAGRCKHCRADLTAWREAQAKALAEASAPHPDPASLRQTFRATPPPPARPAAPSTVIHDPPSAPTAIDPGWHQAPQAQRPPERPAPVHVPHVPPPPVLSPGVEYPQPTSSWSRRWPAIVIAVAVLAIGLSIGMVIKKLSGDGKSAMPTLADPSPMMIPDHMPTPDSPGSKPSPYKVPKLSGKAPDVGMFAVVLGKTICSKLTSCGLLDDFSRMLCRELTAQMRDQDAAGKVQRGQCSYNRAAAAACLQAIEGLSCQARASTDVMAWITKASSLTECTHTYVCK